MSYMSEITIICQFCTNWMSYNNVYYLICNLGCWMFANNRDGHSKSASICLIFYII